jgi:hypothetical protein
MANESKPTAGPSQKSRRTVVSSLLPLLVCTPADKQVQEEDATKLQFGDFADGEALTLTDVQALLMVARSAPGAPPPPDNK